MMALSWRTGLAALAGALPLVAVAVWWSRPVSPVGATEVVAARPFAVTIKAVGDLVPRDRRMVAAPFSSKLDYLAAEGAEVKAGAVIARLNTRELEESLQEDDMKLSMLKEDAATARATAARDRQKLDTERRAAEDDLALKRLELKQLLAGTPAHELTELRLKARAAEASYGQADSAYQVRRDLLDKGILRPTDVAEAEIERLKAKKAKDVAQTALRLAEAGSPAPLREAKRLEVRQAENTRAILIAKARHLAKVQAMEAAIAQAEIDDLEARIKHRKKRLAAAAVTAPGSGVVVVPAVWMNGSRKKVQVGDEVRRNAAFMEIADVSAIRIRTDIKETDIGRVTLGMPVAIRLESVGQSFSGKLASIGVLATDQPRLVNLDGAPKVFEAYVETPARSSAFKPGITVDLALEVERLPHAISVPRTAIESLRGEAFVYVQRNGALERRAVTLGPDDGTRVVVSAGLTAGERVRVEKPR